MSISYIGIKTHPYYHPSLNIGKGAYGYVCIGLKRTEQKDDLVAVKIFDKISKPIDNESIKAEINALRSFKHKNVVEIFDIQYFEEANNRKTFYLFLELCNRGTLEDYVKNNDLSDLEIRHLFKQIVEGLLHIHRTSFLHRDLKPANILLNEDVVKIADFGTARELKEGEAALTYKGTPPYMNPQILKSESYTNKGDIFSLGVTLYFMYFKKTPWFKRVEDECKVSEEGLLKRYKQLLIDDVSNEIFEYVPNIYISNLAKDLIKNMIQFHEEHRYDIDQVMKHPYLNFEKKKIKSPKITKGLFDNSSILLRNLTETDEDKKYRKLFIKELKKQKVRMITERIYYEKDKIFFIHNCMKSFYDLNNNEFPDKTIWYIVLILLMRLLSFKSEYFFKYLDEKKTTHFYSSEDWNLFYSSTVFYKKTLQVMKNCYDINAKNLDNLLHAMGNDKIEKIDEKYQSLFKVKYKPNISFFSLLQAALNDALKVFILKNANEKTIRAMYDLIILVTMNQSMQYSPERGLINYEKYHEDKKFPRSLEIMKKRLAAFKATLN